MKKICRILILVVFIISIFAIEINAHGGNITGFKNKNSNEITFLNGNYYGYHRENGIRHYHQVEWNEEKQRWDILKPAVYYDEKFEKIKREFDTGLEKIQVKFAGSVDGDTAKFELNGEIIVARFLGINTKETVTPNVPKQKWGAEASEFTKNALQNATKIEIEYDEKSTKTDKYNRYLVWIWVDDELLQERLVLQGLAEEYMLQANYRYADIIQEAESIAKQNKVGLWSEEIGNDEEQNENDTQNEFIMAIVVITLGIVTILINRLRIKSKKK